MRFLSIDPIKDLRNPSAFPGRSQSGDDQETKFYLLEASRW